MLLCVYGGGGADHVRRISVTIQIDGYGFCLSESLGNKITSLFIHPDAVSALGAL